jgi:iron(III) transport system permease protein
MTTSAIRPSWGARLAQDPLLLAVYAAATLFLAVFVAYPLARVLLAPGGEQWAALLAGPRWRGVLQNTGTMLVLSTTSGTTLGFVFAYATLRARVPGAAAFRLVALLPLITPPFVGGLSLIFLFGRQGLVTFRLLGLETNIYGWHGLWLAQTLAFFPVAFLAVGTVLRQINPTYEQAARSLGASPWVTFRSVFLPLALPGIAAAAMLVAIHVLADFGNPALVGGRYRVLATEAYAQVAGWADYRMAAAIGAAMFPPALALFAAHRRLMRRLAPTLTGRGSVMAPVPVAPWVRWALFGVCAATSALVVAKYAVIFLGAFARVWGYDFSLTTSHLHFVFLKSRDLANSLRFAALAGAGTGVLATLLAYVIHRFRFPLRGALDAVTLLPSAIPGTLLGLAFVLAFNERPLALAGTSAIVVLSMMVRYLPVGYRSAVAALAQIDRSIERSASSLGADGMRVFRDIVLPLTRSAFTAGMVYAFLKSLGTLSAVIFLVSHGTGLASVSILNAAEQGFWGQASALACALILVALATLVAFRVLVGGALRLFEL